MAKPMTSENKQKTICLSMNLNLADIITRAASVSPSQRSHCTEVTIRPPCHATMSRPGRPDRDAILTNPSLKEVYGRLVDVAREFAVLGEIEITKELVSLLLGHTTSEWQRKQLKHLEPFFAAANEWPDEIPAKDRASDAPYTIASKHSLDDEDNEELRDDERKLKEQLEEASNDKTPFDGERRSFAAVNALSTAVKLASRQTDDIQEIKNQLRVQEILEIIAKNLEKKRMVSLLVGRHELCALLCTGELARKVPVDHARLKAAGKELIDTFFKRFSSGRKKDEIESKPLKEVLLQLERETKTNAVDHWAEVKEPIPETLFVLPAATEEQISSLEKKLNITLPDDYKEFLKLSNGFGRTWNGYHLDNPLFGVESVCWVDETLDIPYVEFHDSIRGVLELTVGDKPRLEWPSSGPTVQVGAWDVLNTLLIPPKGTRTILDAYQEALEDPRAPEDAKRQVLKSIEARYGSLEEMKKLEWAAIERHDSETLPCGTFRQCLEERLRRAKKRDVPYDMERELGGIAYSCRADSS